MPPITQSRVSTEMARRPRASSSSRTAPENSKPTISVGARSGHPSSRMNSSTVVIGQVKSSSVSGMARAVKAACHGIAGTAGATMGCSAAGGSGLRKPNALEEGSISTSPKSEHP